MGKRKSRDEVDRRLERLERILYKRCRHDDRGTCDEESSSDGRSRSRSPRVRSRLSRARSTRRSRRYRSPSPSPPPTDSSEDLVEETGGAHSIEQPGPSGEAAATEEVTVPSLPADIEGLLGLEGTPKITNGIELHEHLRQRWMAILQDGLTEDTKSSLTKKYDPPKNCGLLVPPKLNEEVAAAMNESGIKRDKRIAEQQAVLAAAISAIGKVLNNMISSSESSTEIETLSDSARLLCGLYHTNTETRKSLILPGLNKDIKETMTQSPVSEYLFGDKLQDKVNACKAIKKSAEDLKNTPPQKQPTKKALNYRGPQRSQLPRPSGLLKPKLRQQAYRTTKQATRRTRRSPQRQRHLRRQDQRHH